MPCRAHRSVDSPPPDAGHWAAMAHPLLDDPFVSCVRFHPLDPDRVYVGTTRYPYHDNAVGHGILVSRDGGETWAVANEGLSNLCIVAITLDPTDPNRVYVGTGGNGLFVGRWLSAENVQ